MLNFQNDYSEGAHPNILKALCNTNFDKTPGYGSDYHTAAAKEKIREACAAPDADIYLLVGGTQANAVVIDSLLRNYEGVVSADTGHIAQHEAGAIEASSHKVMCIPQKLGKIDADTLKAYLETFWADPNHDHMVFPGMVYISHPTEYGTLYTKDELSAISSVCRSYDIPLYLDGARLGYGLAADPEVSLPVIAELCDAFYIGGTKVGALFGEAVVFPKGAPKSFLTTVKQHGALLSKGKMLGIQFDVMFTDGLYYEMGKNGVDTAMLLKEGLLKKGYKLYLDSPTNQQFPVLSPEKYAELSEKVLMSFWERLPDGDTVVRLATSWATKKEAVEELLEIL